LLREVVCVNQWDFWAYKTRDGALEPEIRKRSSRIDGHPKGASLIRIKIRQGDPESRRNDIDIKSKDEGLLEIWIVGKEGIQVRG